MRKIYLFFTIVAIAVLTSCSEQMNDEKDVKQRMKEAGVEFKLNDEEFGEIVDCYYRKTI